MVPGYPFPAARVSGVTNPVAHRALRFLLRDSRHPEVAANNTLMALLDDDRGLRAAFLAAVGRLSRRDLGDCHITREAHTVDPVTGRPSRRDFLLSSTAGSRAIVETKVDSSLTSGDQAERYFSQLLPDGVLILVTRTPLLSGLAAAASAQLGLPLEPEDGVYRGGRGGRDVLVLSWSRLLGSVVTAAGTPFDEVAALEAAIEGVTDFVPFTSAVQDTANGVLVRQVSRIAEQVAYELKLRLEASSVKVDSVGARQYRSWSCWTLVTILQHQLWVGYDAEQWALTPGDPDHPQSGPDAGPAPSPFWMNRWYNPVSPARHDPAVVAARRARLDRLGVARPLEVPVGVSESAVVESLVTAAFTHIARISEALHADPELSGAVPSAAEAPEEG